MGAEVVSTDIQPTIQLTSRNLDRNQALIQSYTVVELDWTKPEDREKLPYEKFDVILMSDLFYLPVT
jgi:predicted nicotinamide N-methyase